MSTVSLGHLSGQFECLYFSEAGCQQYLDLATFKRQYENASCESTSTNNVDDFGFFIFLFSVGYLVLLYVINLLTFYQILKFYLRKVCMHLLLA